MAYLLPRLLIAEASHHLGGKGREMDMSGLSVRLSELRVGLIFRCGEAVDKALESYLKVRQLRDVYAWSNRLFSVVLMVAP